MTGRKLAIGLASVAIAVVGAALLAEGAGSLLLGRSLIRGIFGRTQDRDAPGRMRMYDEERVRAAALSEGPFAGDLDPLVSVRLKGGFSYRFHDAVATTDEDGLRTRPGPPPDPKAQRIVVLGDSVAFGFGLRDDETIAHQLEQILAGTMTGAETRPAVFTAACPGWTLEDSERFLLDRLPKLKPDVVLLLPIANDLDDSPAVLESGHRTFDCDPARGVEFPVCSLTYHSSLETWHGKLFPSAPPIGPYALYCGVTPESVRRYAAAAAGIVDLEARLAASGAKLALVDLYADAFGVRLADLLLAAGAKSPLLVLFDAPDGGDALDGDPHPNARCARAVAWRLARDLLARRWVRGASEAGLPREDERYAGRVGPLAGDERLHADVVERNRLAAAEIGPRVDFTDGTGWHQVYGGIWPDGMVGNAASAALSTRAGTRLVVRIARLADRPGLHPLSIRVVGNDVPLATIEVQAPVPGEDPVLTRAFTIPRTRVESGFLDVRLVASGWVIEKIERTSRLAAFQLRSLAVE